ncbi:MAG TPA: MopE-related protein [Candidatus Polarisedimenticolaceae bacterium]
MLQAPGVRALFVLAAVLAGLSAFAADDVALRVDRGPNVGEVQLTWTGGAGPFDVYRSSSPGGIVDAANWLGQTTGSAWTDTPPADKLLFYRVVGTCVTPTPEICDGIDDDCDGTIDNGCTGCVFDTDCPASEHCDAGTCVPDVGQGGFCSAPSQCSPGLSCTDDVCCDGSCVGVCAACDLAGNAGTCSAIPAGTDPDAECAGVSCTGYYWGWSGDSCLRKADVSASQATCDGAFACRTQAQECGAQTTAGPTTLTCHPTCQDPNLATCSGTTAGSCTNVNPGTQSCGVGACQVTVNQCINGAPNTCTPGNPTTETCNDVDDNCDGTVDNGAFSDSLEPNPDCTSFAALSNVGSDQTRTYSTMTVYPSGDADLFRFTATETDSSCACGAFSFDEDYNLDVTLTVPASAGSYELCVNVGSCSFASCVTVPAGTSQSLRVLLDGDCTLTDNYITYVRVRGVGSPGFECVPYTLTYFFDAGYCR